MIPKKGDVIELDCGYNGMDDTRPCKLLENPKKCAPLFENSAPSLLARVMILGTGEVFTAEIPET